MIERLVGIGRAVVDVLDIGGGRVEVEAKTKTLSLYERHRLERECGQILEKEDFGRKDFGNFCQNMMSLSRAVGLKGSVGLNDRNRNFIYFKDSSIEIHSLPDPPEDTGISKIKPVAYREELVYYKGSQPVLDSTTTTIIIAPQPTDIFSYFRGEQSSALVGDMQNINESVKVSDRAVQAFCKRVYEVYATATDGLGVNFAPR